MSTGPGLSLNSSKALVTLPRHGERCLVVNRRSEPTACGVSRQEPRQ